ncbi:MAG: Ig-like domain-containing protein [Acidimicrobiales bacterium]
MLPLALVVGLFGVSQAETASALGPAILVSVTVSPAVASVAVGATEQFTATGHYSDLSTKNLTDSVTWSSSSSGTATISSTGLATGVGAGVATITAKASSGLLSGTAALTVTPVVAPPAPTLVSVTVSPAVASVAVGATEQFTATGTYSDLSTQNLTDSVTWSSSSSGTATISSTGLATGVGAGAATITAADSAALLSGTAALTVTPVVAAPAPLPATLVSVVVTPAVGSVAVGATQQFAATGVYSDASTQDLTDAVTWSSSDSGTATISSTGLATGVGAGAATITAADSAALLSGTAALTVTPITVPVLSPTLVSVVVTPPIGSVAVGAGEQFTATGIYSDSSTQDLTDAVTWASSDSGTATISNATGSQGLATGVATGAATITATDSAALLSGTAVLTVTPIGVLPPAPAAAQMALSPVSGWRRTPVTTAGANFAPGTTVTVTYLSGLKRMKRATTVLCTTVVQSNGTFSCHGTIPRQARSGKKGQHTIEATGTGNTGSGNALTTSTFNLARTTRRR